MIETYSFGEKMGHARPAIDAAMQKMAQERPPTSAEPACPNS